MKRPELRNSSYHYLELAFKEWLDILGYATITVYNSPREAREFLLFLERNHCQHITQVQTKHIKEYQEYLNTKTNTSKKGGGLSNSYINHHLWSLEKFFSFLYHKGIQGLPDVNLKQLQIPKIRREIVTEEEIKELYQIAKSQESINQKQAALNYQNIILLTIYYACGLRRSEGLALELSDINLDTKILHVRKAKGNKQRLIPFNKTTSKYLQNWIYEYRPLLVKDKTESKLLVNYLGKPIGGSSLNVKLKELIAQSENIQLKEKKISLHSLRHSIATHLLANGMHIQKVQQFLGHSSLDTTEIYTHLLNEL